MIQFRAGLSTQNPFRIFCGTKLKDQSMKKTLFVPLALAGLFVLSAARCGAVTFVERFSTDPMQGGWQVFGNTNLFAWDSTNHVLDVTWDSTKTNSYFYHPLGATFTRADSFCVLFDLQLTDATAFASGSELAIGLLNLSEATNAIFSRAYLSSPDLFEFDYFPAFVYEGKPYPASADATLLDAGANFYFAYDNLMLNPGVTYQIFLVHLAGAGTISGEVFNNGQLMTSLSSVYDGRLGDFRLDTLSVNNYSDDGYGDSILAHGTVDHLAFASPLPVEKIQAIAAGQVRFASDTNWLYSLEQTADFQTWTAAAPATFGNGTNLILQATNPPAGKSYYRVRADLP